MKSINMSVEIVTYWTTLLQLAKAQVDAEKDGNPVKIAEATRKHEEYRQLCLSADKMVIPNTNSRDGRR